MKSFVDYRWTLPVGLILSLASVPGVSAQVAEGQATFEGKCAACHTIGTDRLVGPGLAGIADRRDHDWIISFITNPDGMIADGDAIATDLLAEFQVPMPNLGLSEAEAESVLAYLATAEGGLTADVPADVPATPAPPGNASAGRELFVGSTPLENGGAACVSCHSVGGLDAAGGGTLAVDLSKVTTRYGTGLRSVLGTLPFPVMQDVFADRPLTEQEMSDLTAFFGRVNRQTIASVPFFIFPIASLGAAVLVLLWFGFLGRKRLTGVRKTLIGDSR